MHDATASSAHSIPESFIAGLLDCRIRIVVIFYEVFILIRLLKGWWLVRLVDRNSCDLFEIETHRDQDNGHRTHNERGKPAYQANLYR